MLVLAPVSGSWTTEEAHAESAILEKVVALVDQAIQTNTRDKISISVADLNTGKVIYQLNGETPRVPASVMKIATTVAALEELGAQYRFKTELFLAPHAAVATTAEKKGNKREQQGKHPISLSDLYVRGGGDPSLLSSKLWEIAEQLKAQDITQLGDLVIDDSAFSAPPKSRGFGALGANPYQAALSATSLDHNCYRLFVYPGASGGSVARAMLSLGADYRLINRVRTVTGSSRDLKLSQSESSAGSPEMSVTVSGVIGVDAEPYLEYFTVPTPSRYFGAVLKGVLEGVGIRVHGSPRSGRVSSIARKLLSFSSKDLALILYDLNHYSSNFLAEQIVYALGEEDGKFDHSRGLHKIEELLRRIGIPNEQVGVHDGSGLDRDNRLSTTALVGILVYAYQKLGLGPDLLSSFSRFAATGTLKKRSLGVPTSSLSAALGSLEERSAGVWGKTGSLDGVSSVAGVLQAASGRRLAYALISNGFVSKDLEERIIATLLEEQ